MSEARDGVLAAIRRSLGESSGTGEAARSRIAARPRGPLPKRAEGGDKAARLALFQREAESVGASIAHIPSAEAIPEAVADYLKRQNLPPRLRLAPDETLAGLPWKEKAPLLEVDSGKAEADDTTSLTLAFAAVAESGTLMLHSGEKAPTTLNFLPETHLVVLRASQVVGPMEEAWDRLRSLAPQGRLPRTVNFITGPSRTADIEQRIELGAHGPRRLHVLLLDDEP